MSENPGSQSAELPPALYWTVVASVMAATLLQFLDQTIANVAVPHMQASLNASMDSISWVLTSFIVATAVMIPAAGWIAGRFGTRRPFLMAVTGFIVASMLCGVAANLFQMVAFRILQGMAAAFIGPLAQTILLDITPPQHHPRALSIWGMTSMLGPIIGPTLGGYLTDNFNWRWVFFINLPVGIPAIVLLWRMLPEVKGRPRTFDLWGYVALAVAVAAFQLMLDRGETKDWFSSPEIVIEAIVAACAFWIFLVQSWFSPNPLFPGSLLRNGAVILTLVYMAGASWITIGISAMVPSLYQHVYGLSVMQSGELMAPRGFGTMVMMLFGPRVMTRISYRNLLIAGFSVITLSLWQMVGWTLDMPLGDLALSGFIQGLGLGMLLMPLNLMAFSTLPPALRTDCASLVNLVRNLSGSIAISLFVMIQTHSIQTVHAELAGTLTEARLGLPSGAFAAGPGGTAVFAAMADAEVNRQAAMIAYLNVFKVLLIMSIAAIPLSIFARGSAGSK